jgi:hypothetical protein
VSPTDRRDDQCASDARLSLSPARLSLPLSLSCSESDHECGIDNVSRCLSMFYWLRSDQDEIRLDRKFVDRHAVK